MSKAAALDHVIVTADALAPAVEHYRAAGFTVTPGGRHDVLPTENALVAFADGRYLELLAAREPAARAEWRALAADAAPWERHLHRGSAITRRFLASLVRADGVADWCVAADSLEPLAARLRSLALPAAGPLPMGRERRDGERLDWELLLPESRLQPFWIRDRTPRERRVPSGADAVTHANGASGIGALRLRARNVGMAALALGDMLGALPRARSDGRTVLDLGGWRVELEPGEPEGPLAVTLTGLATLPAGIRALGIEPAGRA
jgi:hypothetical protein